MTTTLVKEKEKTVPAKSTQPTQINAQRSRLPQELSSLFGRAPFWSLRDEMDNLITRFSDDWSGIWLTKGFDASLDMSENNDAIEIRMDVPGIRPEEIEVELAGNQLRITGERKEETEQKDKTFHRIERHSGSFSRTVTLPCEVNEGQVQASCENGVLTVSLPKCESAKPQKIAVKPKAK